MKKRIIVVLVYACLSIAALSAVKVEVLASSNSIVRNRNVTVNSPEIRKDKIEWRYKEINGKIYKRQYNVTRNKWIGDWIPY